MKKYLFTIITVMSMAYNASSQTVYNEVKNKAAGLATDNSANGMIRMINQFKVDALDYLLLKMREQMPDSAANYLDKQAYAMNNFVNFYIQTIVENQKMPDAYQAKILETFKNVSMAYPLFYDTDKEITHAYISNNTMMPFSLDTDWRMAAAAIYKQLGK